MTIDRLRTVLNATAFRPFTLNLADGRSFSVPHPEYMALTGGGRTVVVSDPHTDNVELIDLLLVASITVLGQDQAA